MLPDGAGQGEAAAPSIIFLRSDRSCDAHQIVPFSLVVIDLNHAVLGGAAGDFSAGFGSK
jgi:hypothetical protein